MPKRPINYRIHNRMVSMGIFSGSLTEYENLTNEEKSRLREFMNFFSNDCVAKKVFSGTIEDFLELSSSDQDKILKMYKDKKMEQYYSDFKYGTDYAGTLEEYLQLSDEEKMQIIYKHSEEEEARKNAEANFNIMKKAANYAGTYEDFLKLSNEELNKITMVFLLNSYIASKDSCFEKIEQLYKEIISGDISIQKYDEILNLLKNLNSFRQDYLDGIKRDKLSSEIPKEFLSLVDTDIERPKFGFFDNKKYKLLDNLLTNEYIYKLKTRQIASNFKNEADYNDKGKWKEFIDIKEREYQQLHNQRPPIYAGSFEEYLQESTLVTSEYLNDGYSHSKSQSQQELENQKRIARADDISRTSTNTLNELNNIVNNSSAAMALHRAAVEVINSSKEGNLPTVEKKSSSVSNNSAKNTEKVEKPDYSYKPGPKNVVGEFDPNDMSQVDGILRRNANSR